MTGTPTANPFVGPRPIQRGEPLFGRSTEIRELFDRLRARRIVVLHSPSGAGKSSLVQAGLIPRLEHEQFDVWKPIRVNLDPRGLFGVPEGTNRYLLSAMVSLEEELPPARRRSPAQLAGMDLADYLRTRPRRKGRAGRRVVLIFDQFEEALTVDPLAVEARHELFAAIGRALDEGSHWALFGVREDHLAAFAPYRDRVPTQMANTFRLDLLGLDGAREAALRLAELGGRSFPAVGSLVRNLSMVKVQRPDGSFGSEPGRHVEPVHLQVVGKRMWDAMPPDDPSIDEEDVEAYADVSAALAEFYADAVRRIADGDDRTERALREWVGTELVVGGARSQVRRGRERSGNLDNALVQRLLDAYLVRIEPRAGASWFELGHDRLVDPVLRDNERWERDNLHPVQVQAKLWEDAGRPHALLLKAEAVPEALSWSVEQHDRITPGEREFLEQSHTLRTHELRQQHARKIVLASLTVLTILAIGLAIFGYHDRSALLERAERAEQLHEETAEALRECGSRCGDGS